MATDRTLTDATNMVQDTMARGKQQAGAGAPSLCLASRLALSHCSSHFFFVPIECLEAAPAALLTAVIVCLPAQTFNMYLWLLQHFLKAMPAHCDFCRASFLPCAPCVLAATGSATMCVVYYRVCNHVWQYVLHAGGCEQWSWQG